jgi:hypothetical protein
MNEWLSSYSLDALSMKRVGICCILMQTFWKKNSRPFIALGKPLAGVFG